MRRRASVPAVAQGSLVARLAAGGLALLILTIACSDQPTMRFYPTWSKSDALLEVWAKAGESLKYDLLGSCDAGYFWSTPFGVRRKYGESDLREFTLIVRGRLPMDHINVRAIHMSDSGAKEQAVVEPTSVSRERWIDPKIISWDDV